MDIETPPVWAFSWCYYFAGVAVVSVISGLALLTVSKRIGTWFLIMALISMLAQSATSMTLFWMCRTSLNPGSRSAGCGHSPWYGPQ